MSLNINKIRNDFPILTEKVYGKPLIYFDNAATTQKPRCVVESIENVYFHCNANIHRGVHFLSQQATEAHENARSAVAQFIGAEHSREVIFTRGATEAINLVAFSFGERFCTKGGEIVVSAMEHHSNLVPYQLLAQRKKMRLKIIPVAESGEIDLQECKRILSRKTQLLAVSHVSNVFGTINPVKKIIEIAHKKNIPVLIDGAQAIPHINVNVKDLDADFYVFSGHKIYGPAGIGVLYGKEKLLNEMLPYQSGGEMIANVSWDETTFNALPFKFEAGTPDYIGSVALAEAIKYMQSIGLEQIEEYEKQLLDYCTERLNEISGMKIYGTAYEKCAVVSFNIGKIHHYDIGMLLDKMGVAVRTGHHCAQPLIDSLGITGTVRVSFAFYNTQEEIDIFIEGLKKVAKMLNI